MRFEKFSGLQCFTYVYTSSTSTIDMDECFPTAPAKFQKE